MSSESPCAEAQRRISELASSAFPTVQRRIPCAGAGAHRPLLSRESQTFRSESIQVPRRPAPLRDLPARLDQFALREAHQNGIKRAGHQTRCAAEVVAVLPLLRALKKYVEHLNGLGGQAQTRPSHQHKLYICR